MYRLSDSPGYSPLREEQYLLVLYATAQRYGKKFILSSALRGVTLRQRWMPHGVVGLAAGRDKLLI